MTRVFFTLTALAALNFGIVPYWIFYGSRVVVGAHIAMGVWFGLSAIREALLEAAERIKR